MFTKLTPEDVTEHWDLLKEGISKSMPDMMQADMETMNNVLSMLLSDAYQCWASFEYDDNQDVSDIAAIAVTKIVRDDLTGILRLFINNLFGYKLITQQMWDESYDTLRKWAIEHQCVEILAYTANKNLVKGVEAMGGECRFILALPTHFKL